MFSRWIAVVVIVSLGLGILPVCARAAPMGVYTGMTGQVTSLDHIVWELVDLQPGTPIGVEFDVMQDPSLAEVSPGTLTMADFGYMAMSVSSAGTRLDFPGYVAWYDKFPNAIVLRDNVRNEAGDLVDVVDISGGGIPEYSTARYTLDIHLEFASTTFGEPDAWSILAVQDAPLLAGTLHLNRYQWQMDPGPQISNLDATLNSFDMHFVGPGSEIPAVPEPDQWALLLIGLAGPAGLFGMRRLRRRVA